MRMEVMRMSKNQGKWVVVSEYLGWPVAFNEDELDTLLDALRDLGVNVDALEVEEERGIYSRAYTNPGIGLVVEAFAGEEWDREQWVRNPSWHTIALWINFSSEEGVEEEEGEEEE